MIVGQDEQERNGMLCEIFANNAFRCSHGENYVAFVSEENMCDELREILNRKKWNCIEEISISKETVQDIFALSEGNTCFLILDYRQVEKLTGDSTLKKMILDECFQRYNITPILLSRTLFHRRGGKQDCGRIVLNCGHVFLFGDDPIQNFDSNANYVEEFAVGLYPDPQYRVARMELVDAFLELVQMNRENEFGDTFKSYIFVDRTREDNMIKVYIKKHLGNPLRPPLIVQLPDVKDWKRTGWKSNFWHFTSPLEIRPTKKIYKKKRGINVTSDLNTDVEWNMAVICTQRPDDVHNLASHIRKSTEMTSAKRETLLKHILADVAEEHPMLRDEIFYVQHGEMHSHCLL